MVPETAMSVEAVIETLHASYQRQKTSFIVIVAEGEEEGNVHHVARRVKAAIPQLDTRVTIVGHIQRGGSPTAADRLLASQLGIAAVEGLLNGMKNVMAGIVDRKLTYTPFDDTINKRKVINQSFMRMVEILSV